MVFEAKWHVQKFWGITTFARLSVSTQDAEICRLKTNSLEKWHAWCSVAAVFKCLVLFCWCRVWRGRNHHGSWPWKMTFWIWVMSRAPSICSMRALQCPVKFCFTLMIFKKMWFIFFVLQYKYCIWIWCCHQLVTGGTAIRWVETKCPMQRCQFADVCRICCIYCQKFTPCQLAAATVL